MKQAIDRIKVEVGHLLEEYQEKLEQAWLRLDEPDALTISLNAKLAIEKGQPVCEVKISFVAERVKDSVAFTWDDRQLKLGLAK